MAADRHISALFEAEDSEEKFKLFECKRHEDGSIQFIGKANVVMQMLNRFRCNSEARFCDVVLKVEGKFFNAHRCILAANSQYFYSMFTIGMEDSNKRQIELNHLSSKAVKTILDYFYTRSITVRLQNVEELLEAASFLLLDPVKEACSAVLKESLKVSNWYYLKQLAETFTLPELMKEADGFINKSFHAVVQSDVTVNEEFLDLPVEILADVISRDELMVEKEEDVYFAVLDWVKHDAENRKDCLQELLKLLRYGSLSTGFLQEQLEDEALLRDNLECSTTLKQQMFSIPRKERQSVRHNPVIVGVKHNGAFCHDVESNTTYCLPAPSGFPVKNSDFCYLLKVAVEQDTVFVASCRFGTHWPFQKCSLASSGNALCWQELPHCNFEQDFSCLAVLKGLVYWFTRDRSVVECFDPLSNQWSQVASFQGQYNQFLNVVGTDSHIFVIGHETSSVLPYGEQQSVEKYDPGDDKWVYAAPVPRIKGVYQAVFANEKIYATGYIDENESIIGCDLYTPSLDEWCTIASPGIFAGALLNIGNEVYVFSSTDIEEQVFKTVTLKYDPDNNEWQEFEMFGLHVNCVGNFAFCSMKIKNFYLQSYPVAPPDYFISLLDDDESDSDDSESGDW